MDVVDGKITVSAADTPIIDLLADITDRMDIRLNAETDLDERVSLNMENASVEKFMQRLLAGKNYVLLFRKTGENAFTPVELKIYPGVTETEDQSMSAAVHVPPDAPVTVTDPLTASDYNRPDFERDFGDADLLMDQFRADAAAYGEGTEDVGIRISGIPDGSVFKRIGLETGDIIRDVNGRPTRTASDFIEAIQSVISENLPTIRIARIKHNGKPLPLYININ